MTLSYRRFALGGRPGLAHTLAALAGAIAVGCAGTPSSQSLSRIRSAADERSEPQGVAMPHEACVDRGGDIRDVDVNGDGRPDVRTVQRDGRLFCRETDANFDGRVDITRFFDEQGRPLRVEDDYDFDGRLDLVSSYREGELVSDVLDTNFDGRTDTWRDYRGGRVHELRRDANADGRVDFWETYNEQGTLIRTAVDADGDGEPDPPSAAASAAPSAAPSAGAGSTTTSVEARSSAAPAGSSAPAPTTPGATQQGPGGQQ